jgi:murein DD-endopeptidase MepM/ murein hydrolase activator NlpD
MKTFIFYVLLILVGFTPFLFAKQPPKPLTKIQFVWPVEGKINQGFHTGVDIKAPTGATVVAAADGTVMYTCRDGYGYGNEIQIDHGAGITTLYAHLQKIFVVLGQTVKRGESIGTVDSTGNATGSHLHYEVRVNKIPVNPLRYKPK